MLVLTDGGPNTAAVATALDREGVPATTVDLTSASRPVIDAAFLENAASHEGKFQAVVLPSAAAVSAVGLQSPVSAAELSALTSYEKRYGVRQVDTHVFPGATVGLNAATSTVLDGSTVTATSAGLAGPFSYLKGSLTIDNFSATTNEVSGYVASPVSPQPAGQSFTPLLNVTAGGATGSFIGAFTHDGHEELVVTAAFNANQQYFLQIAHGIITWATRGVHLGYQRNYFAVHVDDVFLADSRWSSTGHCTPGDDCFGANSTLTTPDIRMTAADVADLVAWQQTNGFNFDMIFNGGGSVDFATDSGLPDPVAGAYAANASQFTFIDHTYSHPYLGCIQVAPLVAGQTWHCATPADEADPTTVYIDPSLVTPTGQTFDPASGFFYASQATIESQVTQNLTWAAGHGIPTDGTQIVTGEHSGLAILPQQPVDNPFLAPALAHLGITNLGSDASRETSSRQVGTATTVPRHPINVFYNVSTYADEVNEYNWIYTSRANGGSGICDDNPGTTTCITPLPNATDTQSLDSFNTYIRPNEVRNALSFALSNDPRPFYVHQSNFSEQQIIYPVVGDILTNYRAVYQNSTTPLVRLDLHGQAAALSQMAAWKAQSNQVTAYVDSAGVHVQGTGSASVPLTVPADTTPNGIALGTYGGEQSGWITQPANDTVVAVPGSPSAGYIGVPDAPTIGTATGGNASATVNWTAPARDNGSAITGYTIQGFLAGSAVASVTATAAASATSAPIGPLLNFSSYTFAVSAVNAVGTSSPSSLSNAVVPAAGAPAAPAAPTATAGDKSATVTWTAPNDGGTPITGYTVKAYVAGAATYSLSWTTGATPTSFTTTPDLVNGTSYTFTVTAANAVDNGAESGKSNAVTPSSAPGAPTIGTATAGRGTATVGWTAPASNGGSAITGYSIRGYAAGSATPSVTVAVAASPLTRTLTGLSAGISYTFDVRAINAQATGAASAQSNAVIPTGVPASPTITSATAASGTATVNWTPPTNTGGLAISSYRVRVYSGSTTNLLQTVTASSAARSATVNVTNGQSRSFDVAAVNSLGTGAASARSATVTAAGVPSAPSIGNATSGASGGGLTAIARWSAPSSNGGSAILKYQVTATRYNTDGTVAGTTTFDASASSASLEMTLSAGNYRFTVVAVNGLGASVASSRSNQVAAR